MPPQISLDTANLLYAWGWRGSIAGAILTAVAVVLLMWGTRVRDRDNETRLAAATTEAARANEHAASLDKDAAQARLETERIKAGISWRTIDSGTAEKLRKALADHPGSVNLRYTDGDPESLFYASQIAKILSEAKWKLAAGAVKFAGLAFGLHVPEGGEDAFRLRFALLGAGLQVTSDPLPPGGLMFNVATIEGAPTLMVGSKQPALLQ